jgi:hypothetical protein
VGGHLVPGQCLSIHGQDGPHRFPTGTTATMPVVGKVLTMTSGCVEASTVAASPPPRAWRAPGHHLPPLPSCVAASTVAASRHRHLPGPPGHHPPPRLRLRRRMRRAGPCRAGTRLRCRRRTGQDRNGTGPGRTGTVPGRDPVLPVFWF